MAQRGAAAIRARVATTDDDHIPAQFALQSLQQIRADHRLGEINLHSADPLVRRGDVPPRVEPLMVAATS